MEIIMNTTDDSGTLRMNLFKSPSMIAIFGRCKQGKSHLIHYILQNATKVYKFGVVFCTTKFDGAFNYIPERYIFDGDINATLDKYTKYLKKLYEKKKSLPPNFIIFDDVLGSLKDDASFKNFISTYRHFNCTVILASQYVNLISPMLRELIVYGFCFAMNTSLSRKNAWLNMGQSLDEKEFLGVLDDYTREKYHCLFYNAEAENEGERFAEFVAPANLPNKKFKF